MAGGGLGGNVNFDQYPTQLSSQSFAQNTTSFTLNINPQVGYFVAPDFALGVALGFSVGNSTVKDAVVTISSLVSTPSTFFVSGTRTSTGWSAGIGPFARYFFASLAPTTKLFAQARINTGWSSTMSMQEADNFSQRITISNLFVQPVLTLGCAFFMTPNVAIEPSVSYERSFRWIGQKSEQSSFPSLQQDLTPIARSTGSVQYGIGFQIYF